MALNFFHKSANICTGLDISPEKITIASISFEKGKRKLISLAQKKFPEEIIRNGAIINPDMLTENLKKIIEENIPDIKKVNISVSSHNLFIKTVAFPDMPLEELKVIVPQEASKYVSFSVNDMNVDFQVLEKTQKQNKIDVILCALSKAVARNLVDSVCKAGVEVGSIDVSSFAMIRTLADAEMINNPDSVYVSVLIGYENTDISIIKDGMPIFSHNVQTGKKNLIESLMKGFEINSEETEKRLPQYGLMLPGMDASLSPDLNKASNIARGIYSNIASEIQKTIEFYNSQNSENTQIDSIILGGSGICIDNIDKYIANKIKISTELCNPLKNISHNFENMEKINLPALSTSIGLALKGFEN